MHENEISQAVVAATIEVHRILGPGLLESVYEEALCHEMELRAVSFKRQLPVPIRYKGVSLATDLRLDLLVEDKVIVEIKAVEETKPIHKVQVLTYLRLSDKRLGLLINFHVPVVKEGISRIVNRLEE
jgi:GxxExxY protein